MIPKFTAQHVRLRNDKTVTIRTAQADDAEKLLHCVKTYIGQSAYIPKLEKEITITPQQEKDWINTFLHSNNSLLLVVEYRGEIIGNIDLTGSQRTVMAHTAVIGMGMQQQWRNFGLGTALMERAVSWAKQNPILELLWLEVYGQNSAGIALYRKIGFREHGIVPNFFKKDGHYFDKLTMSLEVK